MGPFIYQSRQNGSVIYSFLGKKGLIVYLAALRKGAIRAAHPYHVIYRELTPPPPPKVFILQVERVLEVELNKDNLLLFFLSVNNSAQPALGYGVRNPHTWTPVIIIRTNRV